VSSVCFMSGSVHPLPPAAASLAHAKH